jgi:hypothetical protein
VEISVAKAPSQDHPKSARCHIRVVPRLARTAEKSESTVAVGWMIKSNQIVTMFCCQSGRKSKNVLTASAITTKRPEPKHKNSAQTALKLHYETKIHFTIRVF